MENSRYLVLAACLTALVLFTATPVAAAQPGPEAQEKEAPLPASLHPAEDVFLVKYRGANPTLKRLAPVYGSRGAWPLLEEGRKAMELARSPRREYSAIAYDAYAKIAWECAALVLLRAEQGEFWSGDEARQAARELLDEVAGYFRMSQAQKERFYAQAGAELAVADQSLKNSRVYTMFCTVEHDQQQGMVYVRPRAANEIRLPDFDEDAGTMLDTCLNNGAAPGANACLVTYARDADGAFLEYLSIRPQTGLPENLPRIELNLGDVTEDGERLSFRARVGNAGERPLRLVTGRVSRTRVSIGNNRTSHFIYFGTDEYLVWENPAGRPGDDGNGEVELPPGAFYEAEYSVRLGGLPAGSDTLYFTGEYAITYDWGDESTREVVAVEDTVSYQPGDSEK